MIEYSKCVEFHGHIGPFLALGYKIGEYGRGRLKPEGIMDLNIYLHLKEVKKPYTCIIDGLQCSTTCTMGKGNIKVEEGEGWEVIMECKGKRMIFTIKEETMERLLKAKDMGKASSEVFLSPLEHLVDISLSTTIIG